MWLNSASKGMLRVQSVRIVEGEWRGDLVTPLVVFKNLAESFTLLPEPDSAGITRHSWLILDAVSRSGDVQEIYVDPTAAQLRHRVDQHVQCYKHVHVWSRADAAGALYRVVKHITDRAQLTGMLDCMVMVDAAVLRERNVHRTMTYSWDT